MKYTTPKGTKYGVGTMFRVHLIDDYIITRIEANDIFIAGVSNGIKDMAWDKKQAEVLFDENVGWQLTSNYQTIDSMTSICAMTEISIYSHIDPTTIKFDFTNTKIKVNNPEESEWIQKAMFNNSVNWEYSIAPQYLNKPWLYSNFGHIAYGALPSIKYKEITIQDILNNQMEQVIEVGDIVRSNMFNDEDLIVKSIIGTKLRFTKGTWLDISDVKLKLKVNGQEIVGYELLKDMEQVIEVGDKVVYKSGKEMKDYNTNGYPIVPYKIVAKVNSNEIIYVEGGWDSANSLRILEKANKQEIIGYELLKDLPGIPAGTKSTPFVGVGRGGVVFPGDSNNSSINIQESKLQDTTWFKPIYKAKEVVVKISGGRKLVIKENKIQFTDGVEFVTKEQFAHIKDFTDLKRSFKTGIMPYSVEILVFKIGCQEFTKEDIKAVHKAIQNIK